MFWFHGEALVEAQRRDRERFRPAPRPVPPRRNRWAGARRRRSG